MKKVIEINTQFGDLIVVEYLGSKNYNNYYLCKCNCGKTREVKVSSLLHCKSPVKHCGCKNFIYKKHKNQKFDPEEASFRAKASNYKAGAKKRNLEYTLDILQTINLLKDNCYYCNSKPSNIYNARLRNRADKKSIIQYAVNNPQGYDIYYNGIDRKDNNKGYIEGNVVTCCTRCNTAKLNYSLDSFKEWVIKIYNNLNNENTTS